MTNYTADQIEAIGGQRWSKRDGTIRVYINNWPEMIGLEYGRYNSGNVSWATLNGEKLANARAANLLTAKVYWENGRIMTSLRNYEDVLRAGHGSIEDLIANLNESIAQRVAALADQK